MKGVIQFLKSRFFLSFLGIVLLAALIWLLGEVVGLSLEIRLASIIVLLVLCLVYMAYSVSKANRFSSAIEQSIKAQAEQQMMGVRPDRREKIEEMQDKLSEAIDFLKRSKLGGGRRSKAALYALPWYVFIGPPASGKTTAIENSGLNILAGLDRIQGVGGTRNCDWIFSDSAIFLDTAGRYVTEHDDRDEWLSFLDTLKKNRPEKPINGVLVGVSLTELVGRSIDEVDQHATKIRRRIDELVSQLEIQFPVYIIFTKCDLLQGFVEFFGELDSYEREQIWGCTLDRKQAEGTQITEMFSKEFDLLKDRLMQRRMESLSRTRNRGERHNIYIFPLEFAEAKRNLSRFVERVFQPNPYQETPIFRGFYFTSGTQEGVPIDQVIRKVAQSFGLQNAGLDGGKPIRTEEKSYFIKNLFTKVVIPDQYLVAQTATSQLRGIMQKAALSTGALVLLGLFVLFVSIAFARSKRALNQTGSTLTAAAQVDWRRVQESVPNLDRMISLEEEVQSLNSWDRFLLLGLSRNGRLRSPAEGLYNDKVQDFVQHFAYRSLTDRVRRATQNAPLNAIQKQELYEDIKTMLLLSTEAPRLQSEEYANYLTQRLGNLVESEIQANLREGGTAVHTQQLDRQLEDYVALLANEPTIRSFPPLEQGELRRARVLVSESQTVNTVYNRIASASEVQSLPSISLMDLVGAGYSQLFRNDVDVPGIYTKIGYDSYFKAAIERESENPSREEWVLGNTAASAASLNANPEELARQLESLYFDNYERAWLRFLQSIEYSSSNTVQASAIKIADLSSAYTSPLITVFERATNETTFQTGQEQLAGALEQAGRSAGRAGRAAGQLLDESPHPLTVKFRWLHDLKAQFGLQEGPLSSVFLSLNQVSIKLNEIGQDRERAAEYTRSVLTQGGGDLNAALFNAQRLQGLLDQKMMQQLFEQPLDEAWQLLLRQTRLHIDDLWEDEVYRFYRDRLANRYPFDANGSDEVDLNDLKDFMHPAEGMLAAFREEHLRDFDGKRYRGRGIAISREARGAFDKAEAIADNLIDGDLISVQFQLQPEQTQRLNQDSPVPNFVRIEVHGEEDRYNQGGASFKPFRWPGFPAEARIVVETQQGITFSEGDLGEWAWFRLLSKAQINPGNPGEYRLGWVLGVNQYLVRYRLRFGNKGEIYRDVDSFFRFSVPNSVF